MLISYSGNPPRDDHGRTLHFPPSIFQFLYPFFLSLIFQIYKLSSHWPTALHRGKSMQMFPVLYAPAFIFASPTPSISPITNVLLDLLHTFIWSPIHPLPFYFHMPFLSSKFCIFSLIYKFLHGIMFSNFITPLLIPVAFPDNI